MMPRPRQATGPYEGLFTVDLFHHSIAHLYAKLELWIPQVKRDLRPRVPLLLRPPRPGHSLIASVECASQNSKSNIKSLDCFSLTPTMDSLSFCSNCYIPVMTLKDIRLIRHRSYDPKILIFKGILCSMILSPTELQSF